VPNWPKRRSDDRLTLLSANTTPLLPLSQHHSHLCRRLNQESVLTWRTLNLFLPRNVPYQSTVALLCLSTAMYTPPHLWTKNQEIKIVWRFVSDCSPPALISSSHLLYLFKQFRKEAIFRRMRHYSRENERSQSRIAELEHLKSTYEASLAVMGACWTQVR
jgi:hypothetical protein